MTMTSRNLLIASAVAIGLVSFALGVIIGFFSKKVDEPNKYYLASIEDEDLSWSQKIIDQVNAENIKENLRILTGKPHLAGTQQDHELATYIHNVWSNQGLDWVKKIPYEILLSYPDDDLDKANHVSIMQNESILYTSQLFEPPLNDVNFSDVVPPFNSYSAPGIVEGELVYVNYGRMEDFNYLVKNLSLDLTDKIMIARYGRIFRGDKVSNAEKFQAAGMIIFSDPQDYAMDGPDQVYPNTWWLPPSGVQRGSIMLTNGDPLTPGYPSTEFAYRYNESDIDLPNIPVHPIGYGDAEKILSYMAQGIEAPSDWQGDLSLTYRIYDENATWRMKMSITTSNQKALSYNVIGAIRGEVEPDRYVLVGNHRDAWVFGALDPSSGTAVMLEVSRVLSKMAKEGWRPRRTILFCSWGAEEYGLIGSYEWVEEHVKTLSDRAVAYLNVDIAVQGNHTLRIKSFPQLNDVVYEAAKKVPQPKETAISPDEKTVYDQWKKAYPDTVNGEIVPLIQNIGSGSDYAPLAFFAGIPCLDIRTTWSKDMKLSSYPLYHSAYETFPIVDTVMDIGFKQHQLVCQMMTEMTRKLASALIIPFNLKNYARILTEGVQQFEADYGALMNKNGVSLDSLVEAIQNFSKTVDKFQENVDNVNKNDPLAIRRMNDQLMKLDRAFIDHEGLPGRTYLTERHLLLAPSSLNAYAGDIFPGFLDLLFEIEELPPESAKKNWELVEKHKSILIFVIQAASNMLHDKADILL